MKTFVIGDIHGGYKGLLQCLERSSFNKEIDRLISLGDVADGWSEVPECVEELLSIKNLIAIRGNHDAWCHEWMRYFNAQKLWLIQGGQVTFEAYTKRCPELTEKHEKEFFSKQHNYYIDDQNRGFVHGGYTSIKGLGHEPYEANYYWDRDLMKEAFATRNSFIPKILQAHKEVYIGHTATVYYNDFNPINCHNLWNLDTGAGYKNKLTIMDIDSKEYWQSDPIRDLYPNENGR